MTCRVVVLESELKYISAGLGLELKELGLETAGLGLGKIRNFVHCQFSLCTFAVFCLGRMTFCQPVLYTQPKISVTYLIFTAELTHGLVACSSSSVNKAAIYNVCIYFSTGTYSCTAIKGLDLKLVVPGLGCC